ncbi:hypothetical protein I5M27_17690 [Adhaeribacter sp. BT258]|uniref:Uncharacterized protein n=1 Tax=Adhaeribacter terrigena TaxID=2793070 RepID=A0ABS1C634_9BACT|nr:hypothetical protein [Adhaeribacter terrigena]MBK0404829.1 hypothetical protein [Adhaeribacter terrigena]
MKNTIKLAVVAFAFAAFTTSCSKTEKTVENTTESVETTVDDATTPEAGDTAVVIDQEADAVIKTDTTVTEVK